MVHGPVPGGEVGPVDRLDPVSEPGGLGVLGEDRHGHVRVQRTHLLQNGLQNGIVTGVAPTVGAADHHAVPGHLGAAVAAENLLIDMQLGVHGPLDGELRGGLLVKLFAHIPAQRVVIAQSREILPQRLPVAGGEQVAVHILVDQIGDAPHGGGDSGQMEPGTLRQGIGKGLREGGEGVDVQSGVKPVHTAADPTGKGHLMLHAQFLGQVPQLFPLLAVAGDHQPQPGTLGITGGKAPDQRGHILDGIEPGSDAYHNAVLVYVGAETPEILQPVALVGGGGEVDAVVDGIKPVRWESPLDQKVHHRIGDADAVVQLPQRPGVDVAEGQMAQRAAHVVQLVVAVNSGHHRHPRGMAKQRTDHIGPGTVAVNDFITALADILRQLTPGAENVVAAADHGGDPQAPGLLGEGAVPEAHQLGGDGLVQVLQQTQDVGLRAAGVTAADQMDDFHEKAFLS